MAKSLSERIALRVSARQPKGKAKIDASQEPKAEAPPSVVGFNFDANPKEEDLI